MLTSIHRRPYYMSLLWTPNLATGIDWQDEQHRKLFEEINRFIDCIKHKKVQSEVDEINEFLNRYARTHFVQEEKAMKKEGFPEAASHRAEHNAFMENMAALRSEMSKGPEARQLLAIKTRKLLADWFFNHVSKVDKRLGDFLLSKTKAAASGL